MFNLYIKTLFLAILSVYANFCFSQSKEALQKKMLHIMDKYQAKVGVAVHSGDFKDSLIIHGDVHYPFQSVYKFHLAIAVLDQVDKGKLKLDQPVVFSKEQVTTDLYSPIKDKYPEGVTLPLSEVLQYTIAQSDNIGCDALFSLLGGTEVVQRYFEEKGYRNLSIKIIEEVQQKDWESQFQNWTTVSSANKILFDYYTNSKKLLSASSHRFLWDIMRSTSTGANRIKGNLPAGTVVAHKTGFSGKNKATGIIAAVNDIGVVQLPNKEVFYISVFVTDSKETEPINAQIIAELSKAAWDYYVSEAE